MIAGQHGQSMFSHTPLPQYVQDNLAGGSAKGRIKDLSKHAPNLEFETKLQHIPTTLHTSTARAMAAQKVDYMRAFFDRLRDDLGDGDERGA